MRYPVAAGRFYSSDRNGLIRDIEYCFSHKIGPGLPGEEGSGRSVVSAVAPHAGYMVSGMNAAHTFKKIKEDGLPDTYVIIGPDHQGVPFDFVMCSSDYLTPLGPCKTDSELVKDFNGMIPDSPGAHAYEHSIEVQIPFIQYIDPDPKILPIIMSRQDKATARRLGEILKAVCSDRDVIVLASSDLSHYIPTKKATNLDSLILDNILKLDPEGIFDVVKSERISACGYGPIATSIIATDPGRAEILKYSDSYDSLGRDPDGVVGYASAVMYRK